MIKKSFGVFLFIVFFQRQALAFEELSDNNRVQDSLESSTNGSLNSPYAQEGGESLLVSFCEDDEKGQFKTNLSSYFFPIKSYFRVERPGVSTDYTYGVEYAVNELIAHKRRENSIEDECLIAQLKGVITLIEKRGIHWSKEQALKDQLEFYQKVASHFSTIHAELQEQFQIHLINRTQYYKFQKVHYQLKKEILRVQNDLKIIEEIGPSTRQKLDGFFKMNQSLQSLQLIQKYYRYQNTNRLFNDVQINFDFGMSIRDKDFPGIRHSDEKNYDNRTLSYITLNIVLPFDTLFSWLSTNTFNSSLVHPVLDPIKKDQLSLVYRYQKMLEQFKNEYTTQKENWPIINDILSENSKWKMEVDNFLIPGHTHSSKEREFLIDNVFFLAEKIFLQTYLSTLKDYINEDEKNAPSL